MATYYEWRAAWCDQQEDKKKSCLDCVGRLRMTLDYQGPDYSAADAVATALVPGKQLCELERETKSSWDTTLAIIGTMCVIALCL